MHRKLLKVSLLVLLVITVTAASAQTSSNKTPTKIVLTKINATGSTGFCLVLSGNTLSLRNIYGDTAVSFPVQKSTLLVTPVVTDKFVTKDAVRTYTSAQQQWMLEDATRAGVKIINNTVRTLVVISRIDRTITLSYGSLTYSVPGHALFVLNDPPADGKVSLGGNWTAFYGTYEQTLPQVKCPTLIEVSPNSEGINNGIPEIDSGTIFDSTMDLGQQNG